MKKLLRFLITFTIGLAVLLVLLRKVGWSKFEEALFLFLTWQGLLIVLLTFLFAIISALRWRFIIKRQGKEISFWEALKLWLAGMAFSYFTPVAFMGGEAVRVVGLKKIKNFSWRESMISVGVDKVFDGTIFLVFMMAGLIAFGTMANLSSPVYTFLTWLCVGILALSLVIFYTKRKEGPARWFFTKLLGIKALEGSKNGQILFEAEREMGKFFSYKKAVFWKGIGLSTLKYGVAFLRITFIFYFLSQQWHLVKSLAIHGFYNVSLFFPMPAALGSLEGAGALVFNSLGYGLGMGIVFAFLCRGADLVLSLFGFYFLIKLGIHMLRGKILKWTEYVTQG